MPDIGRHEGERRSATQAQIQRSGRRLDDCELCRVDLLWDLFRRLEDDIRPVKEQEQTTLGDIGTIRRALTELTELLQAIDARIGTKDQQEYITMLQQHREIIEEWQIYLEEERKSMSALARALRVQQRELAIQHAREQQLAQVRAKANSDVQLLILAAMRGAFLYLTIVSFERTMDLGRVLIGGACMPDRTTPRSLTSRLPSTIRCPFRTTHLRSGRSAAKPD